MFRLFFGYRVHWYAIATKRVLLRHWQALLLAIGVLSPATMPALLQVKFLATPILTIFSAKHGVVFHFAYLSALEAMGLIWSGLQRNNIAGGGFMGYTSTLPISNSNRRMVDLGVLLLSDSLLFLPAIAAAITFPALRLTPSELVIHYLVTGALISLVLAAQLSELHQKFSSRLLIILTTNILLSLSLESSEYLVAWLLQSVALTIALALVFMPESQRPCAPRQWQHLSLTRTWQPLGILFHPALAIQFKALFKERAAETFMRLGASFAMALGADALSNIEEYDYRSLPTGIIALAAIAIMVSGFYRMLHSLHSPVSEYMHTLPVPDGFWALRDASLIIALGFAPFCMIMYPLLIQHIVSPLTAGLTGIAYLSLMVLLRFSQLHGGRQSVLLSTIIAAAWAWFTAISVI